MAMTAHIFKSGAWKTITDPSIWKSGARKNVTAGWIWKSGAWKQFFNKVLSGIFLEDGTYTNTAAAPMQTTWQINCTTGEVSTNTGTSYSWLVGVPVADYQMRFQNQGGYGAAGAVAQGVATASVAYPTGIAARDLLILACAHKHGVNPINTPAGWTPVGDVTAGAGAAAVDSGNVRVQAFALHAAGSETGSLSISKTTETGSCILARMFRYRDLEPTPQPTWDIAYAVGSDVDGGTDYSVTFTGLDVQREDSLLAITGGNIDTVRASAETLAQSGTTTGAASELQDSGTTNGNNVSLVVAGTKCTAGALSTAPVVYTLTWGSAGVEGPTLLLRMRPQTPWFNTNGAGLISRGQSQAVAGSSSKFFRVAIRDIATQTIQDSAEITLVANAT
jgi:hypothetical protein